MIVKWMSIWEKWKVKGSIKITDSLKENGTSGDCSLKFHIQLSEEKSTKDILTPLNEATKKE